MSLPTMSKLSSAQRQQKPVGQRQGTATYIMESKRSTAERGFVTQHKRCRLEQIFGFLRPQFPVKPLCNSGTEGVRLVERDERKA